MLRIEVDPVRKGDATTLRPERGNEKATPARADSQGGIAVQACILISLVGGSVNPVNYVDTLIEIFLGLSRCLAK